MWTKSTFFRKCPVFVVPSPCDHLENLVHLALDPRLRGDDGVEAKTFTSFRTGQRPDPEARPFESPAA